MADESEEITMLHYLMYKALADEHTRGLLAVAGRHTRSTLTSASGAGPIGCQA